VRPFTPVTKNIIQATFASKTVILIQDANGETKSVPLTLRFAKPEDTVMVESYEDDERSSDTSFISRLPAHENYYLGEDGKPLDARLMYHSFVCGECDELRPDVLGYTLPTIFLIPRATRWDFMIKCRRCMRRHILSRLWLAILLAHVFSPFVLAWWAMVFLQTFYRKPA
jgi:hypothetical protein